MCELSDWSVSVSCRVPRLLPSLWVGVEEGWRFVPLFNRLQRLACENTTGEAHQKAHAKSAEYREEDTHVEGTMR